jgi:hypothetical protein
VNILNIENSKTIKGRKKGWETAILYLAPHKVSGINTCANSTPGCRASCLFTAGYGGAFRSVNKARIRKTKLFFQNKFAFLSLLEKDIESFKRYARKKRRRACIRLNGTSDIPFETEYPYLFDRYPHVQFYDYTKNISRMEAFIAGALPKNYHLTFSLSEDSLNEAYARKILENKTGSVVVVVNLKKSQPMVKKFMGVKAKDGDLNDLRFLDKKGSIICVRAKGRAKKDKTGFVKEIK